MHQRTIGAKGAHRLHRQRPRHASRRVEGGTERLTVALKPLEKLGITLDDVALRQPKLDEVFMALTGQALEEEAAAATKDA